MMLSVRVQCYNHGKYIQQALESIIMQQTNFPFEVVIGDDFSTDNSLAIIETVIARNTNPNIVFNLLDRPVRGTYWKDRQKLGRLHNFKNILDNCQGKYIALLDGDDYWTDPLKLQKQVDFMEGNNAFAVCSHTVLEENYFNEQLNRIIPNIAEDTIYSIDDYILQNKTASCSIFIRREVIRFLPKSFTSLPFGDLAVVLTALEFSNKKIKVFGDEMAVYRVHPGGLHSKLREDYNKEVLAFKEHLKFLKIIRRDLLKTKDYKKNILTRRIKIYSKLINLSLRQNLIFQVYKYKVYFHLSKFALKYFSYN